MTDRILKCLDLCEASGLFTPRCLELARASVSVGMSVGYMPVIAGVAGVGMYLTEVQRWVRIDGGNYDLAEVGTIADHVARVATLARECDRVMGGGE